MAVRFLPQVLPQAPGPLNFSPVANALDGIRQQNQQNMLMEQRQAEFQANQEHRNKLLKLKEAAAARGPQAPDAVRQYEYARANGFKGSFMDFKAVARPQMFAPVVVGDALVARSGPNAGTPIYQKPKGAMERAAEGIVQRYAPGAAPAPAQDAAPQPIPQSAPGGAPFAGAQPITYETPPPAAPANVDPMLINAAKQYEQTGQVPPSLLDMSPEELTILKGNKDTANFGKAIEDAQNARNAGQVLTPAATTQIQKDTLAGQQNLENLYMIKANFKPEYQNRLNKFWMQGIQMADAWGLATPEQQQLLTEYTEYRTNAYRGLNDYIKSITGAAMSNEEAKRITKGFIDPGDNPWEGDTPTTAKAKIEGAIQQAQVAMARLNYLRKKGRFPENADPAKLGEIAARTMPLGRMKNMIQKDFNRFRREAIKNGLSDQDADRYADDKTSREYGI